MHNTIYKYEPADIVIYIQEQGFVLKEKSLIALDTANGKGIAFGTDAEHIMANNDENICVFSPLRQGIIMYFQETVLLFTSLINKALGKKTFRKFKIAICVPKKDITEVEKKAFEDALFLSRARDIMYTDIPIQQFIEKGEKEFPEVFQEFKIIIGITKDEPKKYIQEELNHILQYAKQEGISPEQVTELLLALRET